MTQQPITPNTSKQRFGTFRVFGWVDKEGQSIAKRITVWGTCISVLVGAILAITTLYKTVSSAATASRNAAITAALAAEHQNQHTKAVEDVVKDTRKTQTDVIVPTIKAMQSDLASLMQKNGLQPHSVIPPTGGPLDDDHFFDQFMPVGSAMRQGKSPVQYTPDYVMTATK